MQLFFKKNALSLIIFFCLTLWVIIVGCNYVKEHNELVNNSINIKNRVCDIDSEYHDLNLCSRIEVPEMPSALNVFSYMYSTSSLRISLFILPLVVMFLSIYNFHKEITTGLVKNILVRTTYKKYLIKRILKALSAIFIIPIFMLIIYIIAYIISNKTADITYDSLFIDIAFRHNLKEYIIYFILNLIIISVFYVNISLFYVQKCQNIFVTVILSYLTYFAIAIILEVFIGNLLAYQLKNSIYVDSLSLTSYWHYEGIISLPFMTMLALFLASLSSIVVYNAYVNKEGVLNNIEN